MPRAAPVHKTARSDKVETGIFLSTIQKEMYMCTDAPYKVLRVEGSKAFIWSDEEKEKDVDLSLLGEEVRPGMFIFARDRIAYRVVSASEGEEILHIRAKAGLINPPLPPKEEKGENLRPRMVA